MLYYYFHYCSRNAALLQELAEGHTDEEAAFIGFTYVITQIIFSSPGKQLSIQGLSTVLRTIDPRFPENLVFKKSSSHAASASRKACPIPELKNDFSGLMARLLKVLFCI